MLRLKLEDTFVDYILQCIHCFVIPPSFPGGDRKGAVTVLESVKEVISWQTELGGRQGSMDR